MCYFFFTFKAIGEAVEELRKTCRHVLAVAQTQAGSPEQEVLFYFYLFLVLTAVFRSERIAEGLKKGG